MKVVPTELPGAFLIEPARHDDERGAFVRHWCRRTLARHGLDCDWRQGGTALNRTAGTVRGLHFQAAPHAETKLVRCVRGGAFDVIVDLRPDSPRFGRWFSVTLSPEDGRALFVPAGMAHGYQTLADETEMTYAISADHAPDSARGVRWDDPALAIPWPLPVSVISARDRALPTLDELTDLSVAC